MPSHFDTEAPFPELLLRYSQELDAGHRSDIQSHLWDRFGATISPLIVDMSGFTRLSVKHGVVHYLSMIRRMQLTAQPIFESYRGTVVKFEADNAFAYFAKPGDAINASIALNHAVESANILTPDELDIHISCGIDHGECLLPDSSDFFGTPVNRASKLGEDLGEPGKILVTAEAMAEIPDALDIRTEPVSVVLAGEITTVHSVIYRPDNTA